MLDNASDKRLDKPAEKQDTPYFYYDESGYMVFTAKYHLERGYCCKNKCRHCPWKSGKCRF
ncbi:hypothetical protein MASR1M45_17860 [Candidatus Kapaibacterium sp.]